MSNRWKILLIVSVVLNLFLAGAVVGGLFVGTRTLRDRIELRRPDGQRMVMAFQALPPDRRSALRDIMRAQALDAAPDMRAAAEARREAGRLIAAEPYDAKAVDAALQRSLEAENRARERINATLAQRLGELRPEERSAFARFLLRGPGRHGPRPPRGGPPEPPPPPEG